MLVNLILQITQTPALADSTGKAAQALQPSEASLTFWDLLIKGGPVLIPIALLSLIAVYIFFERYFAVRKASKIDLHFMPNIRNYVMEGKLDAAKNLCSTTQSPIARMVEKGLARIGRPIKDIESAIENVGKIEIYMLERNISILATIAAIAPMFGFLGTIAGMIKAFYNISLADNLSIGLISGGIYEKMISSAAGIIVGIFAHICYNYLVSMADKTIFKMESGAIDFIDLLQEPTK